MAKMDVFDCQEMPKDIKKYFFDNYGGGMSNDCYIDIWLEGDCSIKGNDCQNKYECENCSNKKYDIVEQWLRNQGVTEDKCIVKRWW